MNKDETTEKLVEEVIHLALTGILPDGDHVNLPTRLWAESWAEKFGKAPWKQK